MTELTKSGDVRELLPWYATGRLSDSERQRVEAELAGDAALRSELARIQAERVTTQDDNAAIPVPSSRMWEQLSARISEAETSAAPGRGRTETGLLDGWLAQLKDVARSFDLSVPQFAMAGAAAAVLVLQAAAIGYLWNQTATGPDYVTASGPEAGVATGPTLLVAFQPTASLAEISALLNEVGGETVAGPKAGGYFTIRIKSDDGGKQAAETALTELRRRTDLVRFASHSQN